MPGNRDKTEFTPEELELKANVLRDWATQFEELAERLRTKAIPKIGIRFEKNLDRGSKFISSFISEALRTINENNWDSATKTATESTDEEIVEKLTICGTYRTDGWPRKHSPKIQTNRLQHFRKSAIRGKWRSSIFRSSSYNGCKLCCSKH